MLVVSGEIFTYGQKTELIDLGRPNIVCDLPDLPILVSGAVGFNNDNGPTICGGRTYDTGVTDDCYNLNSAHQWESWTSMTTTTRAYASVTQIERDEVLVIGGFDNAATDLKSTEIISSSGSEALDDLPFTIFAHCTLKINDTTALICGGRQNVVQDTSDATWFMDLFTFKISPGPKLQTGREHHGCATLYLGGKNYGIVTGGFQFTPDRKFLDTTEILYLEDDLQAKDAIWKPGK